MATRGRKSKTAETQNLEAQNAEMNRLDEIVEAAESAQVETAIPARREYDDEDLIACRSIVQGFLNFKGKKSDTVYQWEAVNDVTNVEYQDLKSAMLSRSAYIMRPYFVIEDDYLLSFPEWAAVKEVYDKMYSKNDLTEIFKIQSVDKMGQVLSNLPDGVKKQIGNIAKEMMEKGTLDSIKKVKKIDEVLGTSLMLFVSEN